MTPIEVLSSVKEGRVDHRTLRHAVRLPGLVEIFDEDLKRVDTYEKGLKARHLAYRLTRRGNDILAQKHP